MTRDTKLGLLVALAFIVGIMIILSSQVSGPRDSRRSGIETVNRLIPEIKPDPAQAAVAESRLAGIESPLPENELRLPPLPNSPKPFALAAQARPGVEPTLDSRLAGNVALAAPMVNGGAANPVGPAPAIDPVAANLVAAVPAGWQTYEAQPGDSLAKISQKFYNSRGKYKLIYQANRDKMPNENTLKPGMKLVIPPAAPATAAVVASPSSPPQPDSSSPAGATAPPSRSLLANHPMLRRVAPGEEPAGVSAINPTLRSYTIRGNDTLYKIAAGQLGDGRRWQEIMDANKDKLRDPKRLPVGVTLCLPARDG